MRTFLAIVLYYRIEVLVQYNERINNNHIFTLGPRSPLIPTAPRGPGAP